jgi:hypothetical protein
MIKFVFVICTRTCFGKPTTLSPLRSTSPFVVVTPTRVVASVAIVMMIVSLVVLMMTMATSTLMMIAAIVPVLMTEMDTVVTMLDGGAGTSPTEL